MVARLCLGDRQGCLGNWDVAHDRRIGLLVAKSYSLQSGLHWCPTWIRAMLAPPIFVRLGWTKEVNRGRWPK